MSHFVSHAIVVFGCSVRSDGTVSRALERRLHRALDLARDHPDSILLVTGGNAHEHRPAEGPVMRDWLTAHGVAGERVHVESTARRTTENAELAVPLIDEHGVERVSLVTDAFHMRRSLTLMRLALRKHGLWRIHVEPVPAPDGKRGARRILLALSERAKLVSGFARLWVSR
ncbi:YdcF family protein [Myxococcota bacterium]